MTILLCLIGFGIWLTMAAGMVLLIRETRLNRFKLENIESYQLNPRTRIAQAKYDNRSDHKPLRDDARLGRVSRSNRVVVGGEEDSELHRSLSGNPSEADNE